jgi:protein-S-isoprenylcysteine O-methyltransferase Ste14
MSGQRANSPQNLFTRNSAAKSEKQAQSSNKRLLDSVFRVVAVVHFRNRESCVKATRIEFRLRMPIMAVILTLGFGAPWLGNSDSGARIPLLMALPLDLNRHSFLSFPVAMRFTLILAVLIAAKAMVFRVWGAAYLGPATVIHSNMKGDVLVACGPYRYLRNPLYVGLWAMTVALAFLMPVSGALFVLLAVPLFLLRLTLGEEAFLAVKLGQPYQEYLRAVPRLVPRLRTALPPSALKPQWLRASLSEFTSIGIFLALTAFSWNYDFRLLEKLILVSFGLSLLARAFLLGTGPVAGSVGQAD